MRASSVTNEILDILKKEHTHLTEVEIYQAVKSKFTAVNHSTVYRALRRLVDDNQVQSQISAAERRFSSCAPTTHTITWCASPAAGSLI
jgi:Fe2+ or Zn2+ uptake regulation protein